MAKVNVPLSVTELATLIELLEEIETQSDAPGFCVETVLHLVQCLHDHYYKGVFQA